MTIGMTLYPRRACAAPSFQGVQLPGRKPPPRRAAAPPPLPEGWAEDVDPSSGNKYFYNEATGETTWERPFGRGVESMRR